MISIPPLRIDPSVPQPIWSQIEEGVRRLVATGALAPGALAPSVRELAAALRVNPGTVARAYQRLTDASVLEVRRGDGTYVAAEPPVTRRAERQRALKEAADRYVTAALAAGAERDEAQLALAEAWPARVPARKGER